MKLSFISLASGSSGNCYYLGTPEYGLLIDAGIGARTIKKVLKDNGIDLSQIIAVLVTHDHADHIKTVGVLGEKLNIPIYSTEGVHRGINKSRYVEDKLIQSKRVIEKEVPVEVVKEVPVEVIKEVPVETIREVQVPVEIVKEVPVEVIKEIPVEKEIAIEPEPEML